MPSAKRASKDCRFELMPGTEEEELDSRLATNLGAFSCLPLAITTPSPSSLLPTSSPIFFFLTFYSVFSALWMLIYYEFLLLLCIYALFCPCVCIYIYYIYFKGGQKPRPVSFFVFGGRAREGGLSYTIIDLGRDCGLCNWVVAVLSSTRGNEERAHLSIFPSTYSCNSSAHLLME